MTKLILVRHGQTEWNITGRFQGQSDTILSEVGRKQARLLAENFETYYSNKVDAIYSSDLKRAFETAETIGKKFSVDVKPDPRLREIHFGKWEGEEFEAVRKSDPEMLSNLFERPDLLKVDGGESFAEVQNRAMESINEIVAANPNKIVVVAAHGAILRTIIGAMMEVPLRCVWKFRQDNTAVNLVRHDGKDFMIALVNSTAHLQHSQFGDDSL